MSSQPPNGAKRATILYPLALLGGIAMVVFLGFYLYDFHRLAKTGNPIAAIFEFDTETLQNTLGSMAQTVAAVLGIVITVASIVVQLAATRYTPRIADMFFRDRTNLMVLGFFVIVCINAVWVSVVVEKDFQPTISIIFTMFSVTASLLLMVPYFAYVFDFLDPDRVISRIQREAVAAAIGERHRGEKSTADLQGTALRGVEQLSDIAVNAVSQKDKAIASGTIDALRDLLVTYQSKKKSVGNDWFVPGEAVRRNPDFVALAPDTIDEIREKHTWLEWKMLRQYQGVYNESLGEMPDINQLIAINTRYVGEAAVDNDDEAALELVVKFFNTYMRSTLNKDDVRTCYNVLHQYRQLCERALGGGFDTVAGQIAFYFSYYGSEAHKKNLAFVTETVAFDVSAMCERAYEAKSEAHDKMLDTLLTLDREAETQTQEKMLTGIRRAQAKLASFYLANKAEAPAKRIFEDMRNERPERLAVIRDTILGTKDKDFWEVIDRGTNFNYIDDERKTQLKVFFSWFTNLKA
jgi:hypothetical protein